MMSESYKSTRDCHLWLNKLQGVISLFTYFISTFYQPASAQICDDRSGQLLINQSFGTASQPVLLDSLTPYPYVPPTCPSDGQYTITATIAESCFNNTWYAVATDHTPNDVNGNMMIVNGTNKAGVFYQQPVSGLCSGTNYEVSLWVLNLLRTGTCLNPLNPNLSINIETRDGQLLASSVIGVIKQEDKPTWRQYSAIFTAPQLTEGIIIKLINTEGGYGCGNDMVIDDFQVRQCSTCMAGQIYVPDAFTPNNDGLNDELVYYMPTVMSYSLTIFNRWGSVIFVSNNVSQKWDGTCAGSPCAAGEYTWSISYQMQAAREQRQTGRILLLR